MRRAVASLVQPAVVAVAAVFMPGGSRAQETVLDRGSFTLYVGNERVGRESFSITQAGQGTTAEVRAWGTVTLRDRKIEPQLTTDTARRPTQYVVKTTASDRVTLVRASVRAGRFSGHVSDGSGKTTERDLPFAAGAVVLDDDIVHHYYFLARASAGSAGETIAVVVPQRLTRESVQVSDRGQTTVETGNGSVPSRHLIVTAVGGTVTDLWVDAAGRVLRVHVPASGFTAIRDEAPRTAF
jgi:hypothetical protein